MKKYFVELILYIGKNNLEERLQAEFKKLEHVVIPEDKIIKEIDLRYARVLSDYQRNKGKAKAAFEKNTIGDEIRFSIGKSLIIDLILIKEEL
jgi:FKBP-type peptidyl-prolyl cis-trans isomerase (trigger factor)